METWQIQHIRKNLPDLLRMTKCSVVFLSHFQADGLVSEEEVDILGQMRNIREQAMEFYNIIQTRCRSFNLLKQALSETSQTGAFAILEKCPQEEKTKLQYHGAIGYDKTELLGRGCFGTKVFMGKYGSRDVAVKKIHIDDVAGDMAKEEVKFLKKLDWHENVVRLFEMVETDDFILIALELCDTDLHNWVTKPKAVDRIVIAELEIIAQSARGIGHLHKNRVVHRDLKPANILMVRQATGDIRVKISDFGMAKKMLDGESKMSVHSSGVGTEGWMAPEVIVTQFQGERPSNSVIKMGFPSDIFSLGCIFYFVLTEGVHPFGEPFLRQANIFYGKSELKQERINTSHPKISSLVRLMGRMIAKEEGDRPQISEVSDSISRLNLNDDVPTKQKAVHETKAAAETLSDLKINDDDNLKTKSSDKRDADVDGKSHLATKVSPITPSAIKKNEGQEDDKKRNQIAALPEKKKEAQSVPTNYTNTSAQNTDIDFQDPAGHTQLHMACHHKNEAEVLTLLGKGANVNIQDKYEQTPLHRAANYTDTIEEKVVAWTIMKILMDKGADVWVKDKEHSTFLHIFFSRSSTLKNSQKLFSDIANYLISHGHSALFNVSGGTFERTPFHSAVGSMEIEERTLALLQKNGGDFNATDDYGDSILFAAVKAKQSPESLSALIKLGADYRHLDKRERSLLHQEAYYASLDTLKLFLKLGLNVDAVENEGNSPIHYAMMHVEDKEVCDFASLFMAHGADLTLRNKMGQTAIDIVSRRKNLKNNVKEKVMSLLKQGKRAGETDLAGKTKSQLATKVSTMTPAAITKKKSPEEGSSSSALITSADNKNRNQLGDLPERKQEVQPVPSTSTTSSKNADVDLPDRAGNTKLHLACSAKNEEAVKQLIQQGANVNAQNKLGESPLHHLAKHMHKMDDEIAISWSIMKYLMSHGADGHLKNEGDDTFLHLFFRHASEFNVSQQLFDDISNFLISKGYSDLFNASYSPYQWTPFRYAVEHVDIGEMTLATLQKNGVDFNVPNEIGSFLLFHAVSANRSPEFLSSLVKFGADFRQLGMYKECLLHAAARSSNLEALKLFLKLGLNVNSVDDSWGNTPLHLAMRMAKEELISEFVYVLMQHGADVTVRNESGNTPIDILSDRHHIEDSVKEEVMTLLQQGKR